MIHRSIILSILLVMLLSMASSIAFASGKDSRSYSEEVMEPEGYLEGASYKLVRGVSNIVTCPGELVKQTIVTIRDRGPMGGLLGPLKGVGMTIVRGLTGVWETASFLAPNLEGDFSAILKPEFVWTPSEKIHN